MRLCVGLKITPAFIPARLPCQPAWCAWNMTTSACRCRVAAEHAMMERLVIDDLLHWARTYKVRPHHDQHPSHLHNTT